MDTISLCELPLIAIPSNSYKSIIDLETGIENEIMEKYKPFAQSINTDERMNSSNRTMKFRLNLKAKLF